VTEQNESLEALKTMVREAWVLLSRLPDADARFLHGLSRSWILPIIRDPRESYGYNPPQVSFTSRQMTDMETVMTWMSWLLFEEVHGKIAVKRILAWSMGVPWREIAAREGCGRRTVQYRMNRSFAAIMAKFFGQQVDVAMEPETPPRAPGIRAFSPPRGAIEAGDLADAGKVFIGGEGFRFHGKPYRDASDAPEKMRGKRR
jgi:hypothetical protein